ncbi:MAG: polysaccharide deacetylase family protein [candidate division WOR-3 bacterium]
MKKLIIFIFIASCLLASNNQDKYVIISFDDGFYSVYKYAYPILKQYRIPITCGLVTSYITNNAPKERNEYSFMSVNEIQELIDTLNIEIASHSVSHYDLTKLPVEQAKYELIRSKQILDSVFNQNVITFIYPYGKTNTQIVELTKLAGYKLARNTKWGEPNLWVDRYLIPIKEIRTTTTIDEIIRHINNHRVTVLLFHRLSTKPRYFTEYTPKQFAELIKLLSGDNRIKFLTLKDLYNQWWSDFVKKYLHQKGWLTEYNSYLFQKIDIDQTRTMYPRISQ